MARIVGLIFPTEEKPQPPKPEAEKPADEKPKVKGTGKASGKN